MATAALVTACLRCGDIHYMDGACWDFTLRYRWVGMDPNADPTTVRNKWQGAVEREILDRFARTGAL